VIKLSVDFMPAISGVCLGIYLEQITLLNKIRSKTNNRSQWLVAGKRYLFNRVYIVFFKTFWRLQFDLIFFCNAFWFLKLIRIGFLKIFEIKFSIESK